jgi:hypothetical protein
LDTGTSDAVWLELSAPLLVSERASHTVIGRTPSSIKCVDKQPKQLGQYCSVSCIVCLRDKGLLLKLMAIARHTIVFANIC